MICPRCGVVNTDDAERCTRCRGSLAPAPPPSAEAPAGADVAAPAVRQESPPTYAPSAEGPQILPPPPPLPAPAWDPSSGQWQPPPPQAGPAPWPPPPVEPAPAGPSSWAPPQGYGAAPAWPAEPPPTPEPAWPGLPAPSPGPWQHPPPRQPPRRQAQTWPGPTGERAWKPTGSLPTYLPWAVLCTILLFPVGGIVAIVYGILVNRRAAAGDYEGASRASRLARRWCLISVVVGLVALVLLASGIVKNPYTTN
jgi:hypothetical protein